MPFSRRHWLSARKLVSPIRRPRRCSIEVGSLEGRLLLAGDITAPVTTLQVLPNTLNSTGYYTASPETVNLTATDADSPNGLTTFYNVDNAGFVAGNSLLLGDGVHTVKFYSVDQTGNREATQAQTIQVDSTAPVVTAFASPTSLRPPNHKFIAVTVTGHVSDASGGVPGVVSYRVTDEYGRVQPSGTASVDANGNYSFVVSLQSSRLGRDKNGRQYTILVTATDEAGNTGSAMTAVVVPHDQGNHGGNGGETTGGNGNNGNQGHGHGKNKGKHGHGKDNGSGIITSAPQPGSNNQGNGNGHENNGHGNNGGNGHGNDGNHGNGNGNGEGHGNGHG